MDSDGSLEGEERNGRSWASRQNNSDMSDEENFSRGAKSIESPPESPPRGGGNLDSPPASPAQDVGSPPCSPGSSGEESPEYDVNHKGGGSPGSPESGPRSPDGSVSKSPRSWERRRRRRRSESESPVDSRRRSGGGAFSPSDSPDSPGGEEAAPAARSPGSDFPSASSGGESSPDGRSPPSGAVRSPKPASRRSSSVEDSSETPYVFMSPYSETESPSGGKSSPPPSSASAAAAQATKRPQSEEDDGRSNISSNSSIGSAPSSPEPPVKPPEMKSHAEDLSDVSDIESLGSLSDNEDKPDDKPGDAGKGDKKDKSCLGGGMSVGEEAEQLDFEADEEREEGEVEVGGGGGGKDPVGAVEPPKDLEEGEISDEGENRPEETEPRPVCRFFSRGQCTWGSSCSFQHVVESHQAVQLPQAQPAPAPPLPCFPRALLRPRLPWLRRPFFHRFPFLPRFVHPGVTDKGNYTMFDMVRPLVPVNNGPPHMYAPIGPMEFHRPIDRPMMGPPPYQQPPLRKEEPIGESAWERGLRQAKELLRKSSKRKETEVDFEEKKMNLSLAQDEFDKENDYYTTRPGSPYDEHYEGRYKGDGGKRYRSVSERFGEYGAGVPPQYYGSGGRGAPPEGWHYDERSSRYSSRHHQGEYHSRGGSTVPTEEYYDRKRHKGYPSREVIVQRSDKTTWKEDSPSNRRRGRGEGERGGRGDEWADPWMRSKSPSRGKASSRPRKKSYSSQSSYSSSSSSRSSSYSSYSRSRSGSRSSRSGTSRSRSRSVTRKKVATSPIARRVNRSSPFSKGVGKVSPGWMSEKRAETERSLHMNPPPPSPRASSPSTRRNPTPPTASERVWNAVKKPSLSKGLGARLLAAAMRGRSGSSRSSSGSDSSGSSSDSSSDTMSSSSSSRPSSPPPPKPSSTSRSKRIVLDEKLAQAMKVKAMDAMKLSGQKQQIKLTLKGREGAERLQMPTLTSGRKRPAESPPFDGDTSPSTVSVSKSKKPAPSRREELLKQLKAVEDAIARKRSKI